MAELALPDTEQIPDGYCVVRLGFRDIAVPVEVVQGKPLAEIFMHRLAAELGIDPSEITPDLLTRYIGVSGEWFYGATHSPGGHQHEITPAQQAKIDRLVNAHPLRGLLGSSDAYINYHDPMAGMPLIRSFSYRLAALDRRYVEKLIEDREE
jgi:hypothetical protein